MARAELPARARLMRPLFADAPTALEPRIKIAGTADFFLPEPWAHPFINQLTGEARYVPRQTAADTQQNRLI
jgi:hypothetical protein